MKWLENKGVALGFTLLCILFSIFILGGNHINKQKKELYDAFENGVPGVGFTAAEQVAHIKGQGMNLITVLKNNDTGQNIIVDLEKYAGEIDNGKNADEKMVGAQKMYDTILEVYDSLEGYGLDAQNSDYIVGIWAEAKAGGRFIITSGYQAMAQAFNEEYSGFPAGLISSIRGLKAETFISQ